MRLETNLPSHSLLLPDEEGILLRLGLDVAPRVEARLGELHAVPVKTVNRLQPRIGGAVDALLPISEVGDRSHTVLRDRELFGQGAAERRGRFFAGQELLLHGEGGELPPSGPTLAEPVPLKRLLFLPKAEVAVANLRLRHGDDAPKRAVTDLLEDGLAGADLLEQVFELFGLSLAKELHIDARGGQRRRELIDVS